jgi:hypothetical protein
LGVVKVASAPVVLKVKIPVLSIAQQDGRTLTIVEKDKLTSSVFAVDNSLATAPGISISSLNS